MNGVHVRFVGSGNGFADGGRSNACIHVTAPGTSLLLDCGGSALPAMKRMGIDPATIDAIAITHLHGDHFGGIPFLVMEQHFKGRAAPLTIAGPAALERSVWSALDALFADFRVNHQLRYPLRFVTLTAEPVVLSNALVSAHPVKHVAEVDPHGLRVETSGVRLAYSGDAAWSDALPALAEGTDLFICECNGFTEVNPVHLNHRELVAHLAELHTARLILTHLGDDSLAHLGEFEIEHAEEGTELFL